MRKGQGQGQGHGDEPISRGSSSCAACKLLKRRCDKDTCIFAPYFRADEPKKFAKVHKVFGASNVSKILQEVPQEHRHDTVLSLSYEAEARLLDPVYGCLGPIAFLQHRMEQLTRDLAFARARLAVFRNCQEQQTSNADPAGAFDHEDATTLPMIVSSNDDDVAIMRGEVVIIDHYDMPTCQNDHISGSELELTQNNNRGCYSSNTDFGQVPLLPL